MRLLSALAAIGVLSCQMMCGAQMVGPTPQPPGVPITLEEAEQVHVEKLGHSRPRKPYLVAAACLPVTLSGTPEPQPRRERQGNHRCDTVCRFSAVAQRRNLDQSGGRPGFGLSNTFGVAGYPSREAYKLGKAEPYFLMQRRFLRQTIDWGARRKSSNPT